MPVLDRREETTVPLSTDTYQDEDGNVWAFDPPYDDDAPVDYIGDEYD